MIAGRTEGSSESGNSSEAAGGRQQGGTVVGLTLSNQKETNLNREGGEATGLTKSQAFPLYSAGGERFQYPRRLLVSSGDAL